MDNRRVQPPAPARSSAAPTRAGTAGKVVRMAALHEITVCTVLAALLLSGAVWLVFHHLLANDDVLATHPAESWSLRVHGAFAMFSLVLLGSVSALHAGPAWRAHRNRISGGLMFAAMSGLALSGYLLYYAGSPVLRDATSIVHWVIGLLLPLCLLLHMTLGGRWRR